MLSLYSLAATVSKQHAALLLFIPQTTDGNIVAAEATKTAGVCVSTATARRVSNKRQHLCRYSSRGATEPKVLVVFNSSVPVSVHVAVPVPLTSL
jgi:hypothetical protein